MKTKTCPLMGGTPCKMEECVCFFDAVFETADGEWEGSAGCANSMFWGNQEIDMEDMKTLKRRKYE
jgi:hypothetical protein